MLHMQPSSSIYNKKIGFKEKVVSDVNFFKEKGETKGGMRDAFLAFLIRIKSGNKTPYPFSFFLITKKKKKKKEKSRLNNFDTTREFDTNTTGIYRVWV
jgi:hypothetical protein